MKTEDLTAVLGAGTVKVIGQLLEASNTAFLVQVLATDAPSANDPLPGRDGSASDATVYGIYKPIRGEQPLWDFPTGHLAHREVACYLLDQACGWGIVPPTVLVDGPMGLGSLQWWVTDAEELLRAAAEDHAAGTRQGDRDDRDEDADADADAELPDPGDWQDLHESDLEPPVHGDVVRLLQPGTDVPGWLPVFTGELPTGEAVVVAHADTPELRSVAVLDAVLNNSDRKASHLLRGTDGHLWGIDHGVTLHSQAKLRTVLWGWAGDLIPDNELARLARLSEALHGSDLPARLSTLLTADEIAAVTGRVEHLSRHGRHPLPLPGWPAVPWPAL